MVRGDGEKQVAFAAEIGGGLRHFQANHNADVPDPENPPSQRARSIIFLAYGVFMATTLARYHAGDEVTLYVCENGFIALNPPLTGGRLGSLSTRTTHPIVLSLLQQVEAHPGAGTPVLHWFSGSKRELQRAIALGCWFSVGPAMLVSEKARALVRDMPRDRVLTETDGPFAQIAGESAKPWDAGLATVQLADLWANMSEKDVNGQLYANLRRLVAAAARHSEPVQDADD